MFTAAKSVKVPSWTQGGWRDIFLEMTDEEWMAMALEEARKGTGKTAPNPPVGAVIVKDGVLLGRGWHRKAGLPHAEREAISAVKEAYDAEALRGATAYVTLEPCSTRGRTPACTAGLSESGISRVVYGSVDPNPAHAGAADEVLRSAGIEVEAGVMKEVCDEFLRPFSKVQRTGLPWVIWKCAMSLDGKITRPVGEGQWLSGEESRADVQRLRSGVDAILTSGETVRRDRPALTIRVPELLEGREQPWRVVVTDRPETMPKDAAVFSDEWSDRTLVRPRENPEKMLRDLAKRQGVLSVMLEAGGRFSAAMVEAGLVDEVAIYYAPILCGGTVPALAGGGFSSSVELEDISWEKIGRDMRLRARIRK